MKPPAGGRAPTPRAATLLPEPSCVAALVIADVRAAADAQHAEKKRGEDDLHSEEKPQRPKQRLPHQIQMTKIA